MGLRVLYDGYWLHDGPPSGRNVAGSVLRAWAEAFPDDELVVALPVADDVPVPAVDALPVTRRHVPAPVANHQLWVRTRLGGAAFGTDAVFSQNFAPMASRNSRRTAVFVHDAIFQDHPEWFTFAERLYLRGVAAATRAATAVVTSSEAERRRLERCFPAARSRIRAVGLGLPAGIAEAAPKPLARASSRPFILAVGRLNARKNLGRLIEAYRSSAVLTAGFDLVVVGEADGRAAGLDGTARADRAGRIDLVGGVDDAQLKWLYQHAAVFAFPSLDEGFGLPLLEARTLGAVSVVSDIPVFRELDLADAYFDPTDVASIREALEATLADAPDAAVRPGDPARYTWEGAAAGIRELLTGASLALEAAS
ncbi:glycosyltransferase family 1 protein [Gryllotalpicola koreensis]|uniref:Glycosyl transferase family 1 domain-containing protein n=1 Tax=Gryllotalpicola koreensis TaxID=993086 RepID=A0ABP8A0J7_9MICO